MAVEFKYKARKHDGQKLTGTIEAENSEQVVKQLKNRGYYITSLEKKKKNLDLSQYFKFNKRVKISDLAVFSQQFAVMINAGVSLVESLEIMQKQIDHPRLAEVVKSVQEDVETGSSLAEALGNYPDVFPRLYRQLIRAGETGGVLDEVLNRLAEHYERQDELINKVKSALYYPLVVLLVAMAVVIFLVVNVVPTFVSMFSGLGAQLPLPTRMLLGTSTFIQNYWWLILSFILLLAYALYRFYKTSRGKYKLDSLLLKIPVIGNMFKKIYLARFSSTLAILLDSGVDLLSSLAIVEDVVGNSVYANNIVNSRIRVREGENLSETLEDKKTFPEMMVQMINVGEESGSLGEMLNKISEFYDREVRSAVDGTVSLIEPVLIVFLAVVIGFVAISIVTPMFDMFE
ncbi:MAG: type II secretion system F family protein, partial [Halanaerobiales bacterium]